MNITDSSGFETGGGDRQVMIDWNPVILFILACIAVIVAGPTKYVSLAGFGIMGAIVGVLLAGRPDVMLPTFTLAGAGAVLLGVRTIGMLASSWKRNTDPAPVDHHRPPAQQGADGPTREEQHWR